MSKWLNGMALALVLVPSTAMAVSFMDYTDDEPWPYTQPWPAWQTTSTTVGAVTGTSSELPSKVGGSCDQPYNAGLVISEMFPASHQNCNGTGAPAGGWCKLVKAEYRAQEDIEVSCEILYDGLMVETLLIPIATTM